MNEQKPIYVISAHNSFEVKDLVEAAKRLRVALHVKRAESLDEAGEIADKAGIVYWRSGLITKSLGFIKGRGAFLKCIMQRVPVINYSTAPVIKQVYKSAQQEIFKSARTAKGINPIPTFVVSKKEELIVLVEQRQLQYPLIAKPNFGHSGNGVELIEEEADIDKLDDLKKYVIQAFIKNHGDYRIQVIGGMTHMIVKRVASPKSTKPFLNNASQGGTCGPVTDGRLYNKLAKVGPIIAAIFGYTVCGIDILEDEKGNLYFMEINSVPQWFFWKTATNKSVADHLLNVLLAIGTPKVDGMIFESVKKYYLDNLDYLSIGVRFHFLSRLYLWSGKRKYGNEIRSIREEWWRGMSSVVEELKAPDKPEPKHSEGGKHYRRSAHAAHPCLLPYNNFFFKCIFDRTIFSGSAFEDNLHQINIDRLRGARKKLLSDPKSLFTLSTVAVNFLYHYDYFLGNDDGLFDPAKLLKMPDSQKLEDSGDDLDARIYFYTHMIIGASSFYARKILEKDLPIYLEALKSVEKLISDDYDNCTIDHKAEFMVCARLCGHSSSLESTIRSELLKSLSPHGAFLINSLNTHKGEVFKQTLETAEHSNVLALMAFLDRS